MIQGGDTAARQGPTRTTYLEGKASSLSSPKEMDAASEEELIPDNAMASELQLRKLEFEEVGTSSKIPKTD